LACSAELVEQHLRLFEIRRVLAAAPQFCAKEAEAGLFSSLLAALLCRKRSGAIIGRYCQTQKQSCGTRARLRLHARVFHGNRLAD